MTKKCLICGAIFKKTPKHSLKMWEKTKLCSRKCSHKYYSINQKGKKHSEETKRKMSEAHKGRKPYEMTEEIKNKIRETNIKQADRFKMFGKSNPQWTGGSSKDIVYSIDWTRTLRRAIRERDKYTCQICGELQGDKAHAVHHIDYNKDNCNTNNLITLCNSCHTRTNNNRKYWIKYFKINI
jgi:5-methylcytosine-specific restriction endonuclease McrA